MRTLFLLHEQRIFYHLEPAYLELYVPMVASGLLGETSIYLFQRELRWLAQNISASSGERVTLSRLHEAQFLLLRQRMLEFKPDLVVYALTWPQECVPPESLAKLRDEFGFRLCSVIWDHDESNPHLQALDREVIAFSDFTIVLDSFLRTSRIRNRIGPYETFINTERVTFLPTVPAPMWFYPRALREHDVTISGSSEGYRVEVYQALLKSGFRVHRSGGMMQRDNFLGHEEYARDLSQSRIVVNTQTMEYRLQLKGRVAQCLASGTFLLEQENPESLRYLEGIPVVFWSSLEELKSLIRHFLEHDDERESMARNAHQIWKERYSVEKFTLTILEGVARSSL